MCRCVRICSLPEEEIRETLFSTGTHDEVGRRREREVLSAQAKLESEHSLGQWIPGGHDGKVRQQLRRAKVRIAEGRVVAAMGELQGKRSVDFGGSSASSALP